MQVKYAQFLRAELGLQDKTFPTSTAEIGIFTEKPTVVYLFKKLPACKGTEGSLDPLLSHLNALNNPTNSLFKVRLKYSLPTP